MASGKAGGHLIGAGGKLGQAISAIAHRRPECRATPKGCENLFEVNCCSCSGACLPDELSGLKISAEAKCFTLLPLHGMRGGLRLCTMPAGSYSADK